MKLTEQQTARVKSLADKQGRLKPSDVVADAKQKDSPLHILFVWDVKKAAFAHWMDIAREICGSVTMLVEHKEYTMSGAAFVRDPEAKGEGYRSVEALRDDPVQARQSLIYTLEVASGHLRRAFDLAQPLGLADEVDALLAQITGLQRVVKHAA